MKEHETSSYSDPGKITHDAFIKLSMGDDYVALSEAIVSLALYDTDRVFCERNLIEFAEHQDQCVRGNAILGFGHIARRFGECSPGVRDLVEAALRDESDYVRGQATSAVDDLTFFLGWQFEPIEN